jgi:hypothetical protein
MHIHSQKMSSVPLCLLLVRSWCQRHNCKTFMNMDLAWDMDAAPGTIARLKMAMPTASSTADARHERSGADMDPAAGPTG